jgi:fumarate hydratase, class II
MKWREEIDTLGVVKVPFDCYWGAQTQRSLENFCVGIEKIPIELVRALVLVKKACAIVNCDLKILSLDKKKLIVSSCDDILSGSFDDQFNLSVWQTGSGTQTNMNVNEVIANIAIEKAGGVRGSKTPIHPNDHVNLSQSSNDVFSTAMHVAVMMMVENSLIPHLTLLCRGFAVKAEEFKGLIKVGRTHLMDAAPITLGQEFSSYSAQIEHGIKAVERSRQSISMLALGGTAVGTGLNAPSDFGERGAKELSALTGFPFVSAPNKFQMLAAHDALVELHGSLKVVASAFMKIANDIRWLASGPRCGLGEISLPENEPGSSIMPGKVNPTQCESMTMVAAQVLGNTTVEFAGSLGNFELNVFKPVIIFNLLQSIRLLGDSAENFFHKCLCGIIPNDKHMEDLVENSLMLATPLNPVIGYDKASQLVKKAYHDGISLREANRILEILPEKDFNLIIDPKKMV